jgi:hypothetical protein
MELAGKSVAALHCGSAFAVQLEADLPPSPLFSRILSPQIVSRVSKDSCAVNLDSVPIHIIIRCPRSVRHCQHLPADPLQATELCQPACLSSSRVLVHSSRQEHESPPPSIQATQFRAKDAHSRVDCTVSEPPCPFSSSLPSEARMLAGLWAS